MKDQKQEEVEYTISRVLNSELPMSYDKEIFRKKKHKIFEHVYHQAEIGDDRFIITDNEVNNTDYDVDSYGNVMAAEPKSKYGK